MEALNAKERTIGLLKFLGVFFVLVVLLVWGIFYDARIPTKQLELLKAKNATLSGTLQYQKAVLANMDSLYYQFGRYDKALDKEVLNVKMGREIAALSDIATTDTATITGLIVGRSNNIFSLYFGDKKQLSALSGTSSALTDKDQKIKELSDKNEKLSDKLEKLQREYDNLHDKLQSR